MPRTSPLAGYLATQKLSYAAFARLVGADRARIQRCAKGKRRPGLDLALAIERETGGEVPVASWSDTNVRRLSGRRKSPRKAAARLVRRRPRHPQQPSQLSK